MKERKKKKEEVYVKYISSENEGRLNKKESRNWRRRRTNDSAFRGFF